MSAQDARYRHAYGYVSLSWAREDALDDISATTHDYAVWFARNETWDDHTNAFDAFIFEWEAAKTPQEPI